MKIRYWLQIWKLSNKHGFSKIGFFKFLLGYLFSSDYNLIYDIDKSNDKVTGFNFIEHARIKRLVVDTEYRGKGIGRKIVPDYCKIVYTDQKRDAVKFYEKLGFKVVGKKSKEVYILKR